MTETAIAFRPDWVSPPGDTIADLLEERGWSQAELADRLGYTRKHVSLLINGKAPVTEDTALRLERVLGGQAGFWMAREAGFRAQRARLEAAHSYADWVDWLDKLPVRDLMEAAAIPKRRLDKKGKPAIVEELLHFFGVASPEEWEQHYVGMQAAFRRTRKEQSDIGAISSWLRLGEIVAEKFEGPRFDQARFEAALARIRTMTTLPPQEFDPKMRSLCQAAGVALVFVPAIKRAHVSGVARWLGPHRPLIQLSLYGKTNDRFWFTFFHEAAHLLLHGKKEVFLDDANRTVIDSPEERDANKWAANYLIPRDFAQQLPYLPKTKNAVYEFAQKIEIHPGIVVGRLQHDRLIEPSWMNDLKVSYCFKE